MTSRSRISSSSSISPQAAKALNVSGLSQSPEIIVSRPASIRFAIAISPSRERSSTLPISRRYILTGSSVLSAGAFVSGLVSTAFFAAGFASSSEPSPASSASALSITLIPISDNIVITSSICSDDI